MKKSLFLVALSVLLALMAGSAMAQSLNLHSLGRGVHHDAKAPKYCNPCLFYGGDWDDTSSDWVIFADADGAAFGGLVQIYSAFTVPSGQTWDVTGLFANVGFIGIDHMSPKKAEWAINSGMKAGKKGKVVAHGKTKATAKVTGRSASSGAGDVTEYTVLVGSLPSTVTLASGTYFESVVPPCDSTKDSACSGALYYESDTFNDAETSQGAHHFGPKEPKGKNFQNGDAFGLNYIQINADYCTQSGYPAPACNWMSDGVIGTME